MAQPVVATSLGRIAGTTDGGVTAFLGVPFAAPPLGHRRFGRPAPAESWEGLRQRTEFGPSPSAAAGAPGRLIVDLTPPVTREDCLTLNVWTPSCEPTAKRPVLVFFYGGAFVTGSSALPIYHGDDLAARGDVVVSVGCPQFVTAGQRRGSCHRAGHGTPRPSLGGGAAIASGRGVTGRTGRGNAS